MQDRKRKVRARQDGKRKIRAGQDRKRKVQARIAKKNGFASPCYARQDKPLPHFAFAEKANDPHGILLRPYTLRLPKTSPLSLVCVGGSILPHPRLLVIFEDMGLIQ